MREIVTILVIMGKFACAFAQNDQDPYNIEVIISQPIGRPKSDLLLEAAEVIILQQQLNPVQDMQDLDILQEGN